MPINNEAIQQSSVSLRDRASTLRHQAGITLIAAFIALVAGFSLFVTAGEIVARESDIPDLTNYADKAKESVESIEESIDYLVSRIETGPPVVSPEMAKELRLSITRLTDKTTGTNIYVSQLSDKIGLIPNNSKEKTLSILVTRIGAVFVLIFSVKILITLYQYNIRLANFYDARADALDLLGDGDESAFERICAVISPQTIDFGKTPTSSLENVAGLSKSILRPTDRRPDA